MIASIAYLFKANPPDCIDVPYATFYCATSIALTQNGEIELKKERPVNLDLGTMQWPATAIASILHRISAVIIWVAMIVSIPVLYVSLSSADGFNSLSTLMQDNFIVQFIAWGFLTAMGYYAMGSIKHIIQEFGHFETLQGGKIISVAAIGLGIVISLLNGYMDLELINYAIKKWSN